MSNCSIPNGCPGWKAQGQALTLQPGLWTGLKDSSNLCALTALLIFVVYLLYVGRTRPRIVWMSFFFIMAVLWAKNCAVMGIFDPWLSRKDVIITIRNIYLAVGSVFLIIGVLNLADWYNFKKQNDVGKFIIKLPAIFKDMAQDELAIRKIPWNSFLNIMLTSVLLGGGLTFMGSIVYHDYFVYIMSMIMGQQGNGLRAYWNLILSNVVFVIPLIAAAGLILWPYYKASVLLKIKNHVAMIKIVSSALFLSTGFGLLYAFMIIS